MLLRQMRYFVAVVDAGSFTEAAEQCYISSRQFLSRYEHCKINCKKT